MRTKRNWLRTMIAMLTLVATVLETGFTSVETLAAEITTEEGIVVNNDAVEEASEENLDISVEPDNSGEGDVETLEASEDEAFAETAEETPEAEEPLEQAPEEAEAFEEAEATREGTLDVSDSGITGSGYDELSVYVNTDELANKDKFRIEFAGAASASYNPVLNEDLDKTNGGRYDFEGLEGGDFTIRAKSSDNVILSYAYNEDGYPLITVKSEDTEKVLTTKLLTAEDDSRISAVSGEGYDSVKVEFATDNLSDRSRFKLVVESDANAKVNGSDAKAGISGLSKGADPLVIEDLEGKSFVAYVVSDNETKLETVAEIVSAEDGTASIEINDVAVKRVYEYEDSEVYVRATLETANAIPDDADFVVTKITPDTEGYNYEAYMQALNDNAEKITGEESTSLSEDNVLLYDIAFFAEGENGNKVELQPEEGSVRVNIQFKKNQLEKDLLATSGEDVKIVHLPLADGVKDSVDTTADATDISASDINIEVVGEKAVTSNENAEFTLDSFSAVAVVVDGKAIVNAGPAVSYLDALGNAIYFGVTANSLKLGGHMDTNFATGDLDASCNVTAGIFTGNHNPGDYIVASYSNGSNWFTDNGSFKNPFILYTTKAALAKMNQGSLKGNNPGIVIDTSMSEDELKSKVSALVSGTLSARIAANAESAGYDAVEASAHLSKDNNGNYNTGTPYVLDLTDNDEGTYYFNFASGQELKSFMEHGGPAHIRLNSNQTVVFNIGGTDSVSLGQFFFSLDGADDVNPGQIVNSKQASDIDKLDKLARRLIFNIPGNRRVDTSGSICGTVLCPESYFKVGPTSAGWLVADSVENGGEWHGVWQDMPKSGNAKVTIPVNKKFVGGSGNWQNGFTFKLERVDDNGNVDTSFPAQTVTLNGGDSEDATGEFQLDFNGGDLWWADNTDQENYAGYEKYHAEWYRISEDTSANRSDVTYNIYDEIDDKGYKNSDYWFVHLFIYKDEQNPTKLLAVKRTARVIPGTPINWGVGLPCQEDRAIVFKNLYSPVEVPVNFEGIKKINGSAENVPDGKFEFSLYDYKGSNKFSSTPLQTKPNVGSTVAFDPITFKFDEAIHWDTGDRSKIASATEAYHYRLIKETKCEAPYTKDPSVYIAKITLKKEKGKLTSSVTYYKFANEAAVDVTKAMANKVDEVEFVGSAFEFNNTYSASGSTRIYGHKKIENRNFKRGDVFTFTLTPKEDNGVIDSHNAPQTVTIRPESGNEADFDFDELTYTLEDAGKTYTYTVEETQGSDANIVYSTVTYDVHVTVKDNKDGTLEVTNDSGRQNSRLNFTNIYGAKGKVQFYANKQYKSGSALDPNRKFSFVLAGDDIEPQTKTVTGQGTVKFEEIKYNDISKAGTYHYTINEVIPEGAQPLESDATKKVLDGVIYDARTYNIDVVVSDNGNGELTSRITAGFDNEEKAEVSSVSPTFINDYRVDEITDSIGGNKVLHGKELERGEFTFEIAAYEDTQTAVDDGIVVMPSATTVQNGVPETLEKTAFKFGDITFRAAGEYKFVISEVKGDEEGIDYSEEQYVVTFTVKDDGNGKLYIASKDKLDSQIIFTNTKSGNGEVPLFAKKVLTGRTLQKDQFEFELKDASGTVIQTAKNDASGLASFAPIKYYNNTENLKLRTPGDKAEFEYTISEVKPDPVPNGYTYDEHAENVTVTVTLNADGSLSAEADNATLKVPAVFNNEYHAVGEVEFDGIKEITGRKFEEEDSDKFYAELYDEAGELVERVPITKSTAIFGDKGGEFKFTKISYNEKQVGVYNYKVKESGAADKVSVDNTVYDVKVTVTDNGNGELGVAKEYSVNGKAVSRLAFTNRFTSSGKTSIVARKEVSGTTLAGKQFSFVLKDSTGKEIDTQKNNDGGQIIFNNDGKLAELNYDQDDVEKSPFVYTISESEKIKDGYTLDTREYTVKVFLSLESDGTIKAENKYYDSTGEPVEEANVIFNNVYKAKGTVDLFAYKSLTGRDLEAGQFKFTLYDENEKPIGKASNVAAKAGELGKASFSTIEYKEEDLNATNSHQIDDNTYAKYYTIKEDIPEDASLQDDGTYMLNGYTYDTGIYNVVVTLKDEGNGKIKTDWYAYKSGTQREIPSFWDKVIAFVTQKNADQQTVFYNKYEAEGALELGATKTLSGKKLNAGDFSFSLTGKAEDGSSYTDSKSNDANGNVRFDRIVYTKPGDYEYVIAEDIPKAAVEEDGLFVLNGVKYDPSKYTVAVKVEDQGNGKLSVSASVNGGSAVTSAEATDDDGKVVSLCKPEPVGFVNVYDCKPIDIVLGGTKTLVGRDLTDENEFSFAIESAAGNTKAFAGQTITMNKGINGAFGKFAFDPITFSFEDMKNADGTYADQKSFAYVISEVEPENSEDKVKGVNYDTTKYNVVITVTNAGGILSAEITSNGAAVSDALTTASFLNTYDADGKLILPVRKIVQGTNDTDKVFKFELTGDVPNTLTTTAVSNQTSNFAAIEYKLSELNKNTDGSYSRTYHYTVREVDEGLPGYKYSTDVYTVEAVVTSDGKSGLLNVDSTISKNGESYSKPAMEFVNTYVANGNTDIEGTKTLVGKDLEDGEFQFLLSARTDEVDDKGNYIYRGIRTTSNQNGRFSFNLQYTQDDIGKTYYYRVNEVAPGNAAEGTVIYDDSVYDITVNVQDNKDGTLNVIKDIKKGSAAATKCSFTNTDVKPGQVVFEAEKILNGKALGDGMFTFVLEQDGKEIQRVTNKGQKVTFDTIEYELKDAGEDRKGRTYTYTIRELGKRELNLEENGIEYDETRYTAEVTVKVVDNALDVSKVYKKGDEVVSSIRFNNTYKSETEVEIGGHKVLNGFTDGATPLGTYTFRMTDASGNVVDEQEVTPRNAKDPTEYTFKKLQFNQDDYLNSAATGHVFKYKVEEVIPQQKAANVTYAKNEYNVTVKLYYDLNGILQAEKSVEQGVGLKDLDFTNTYKAEGDEVIGGFKTIKGKNLENGAYTFTLTGEGQNQEVKNNGDSFTFEKIHYDAKDIGEHKYEVRETAAADGSTVDSAVYTVTVTVKEGSDGKLDISKSYTRVKDGKTTAPESITFENTYSAKGEIGINGIKIMHNKPLKEGDFTFILKDENGKELQKVSHAKASLESKDNLVAKAPFEFKNIEYTQEDLKSASGSYLSEVKKYYTVEEQVSSKGGVTYSKDVYVIEVTIKSDGTEKLDVTKKVANQDSVKAEEGGIKAFFDKLIGNTDDKSVEIVFENEYNSQCDIDPPLLSKEIMGRNIERGLFTFKITGPAIRSMEEDWKKGAYERTVKNGFYVSGGEIPDKPGEIAVDDILYKFMDLDVDLETGDATGKFIYYAEEVDEKVPGIIYSPAKFHLEVNVRDDGEGHLIVTPGKDKEGKQLDKLTWVQDTANSLTREDLEDKFLNIFNQEGSIDLVGVKKLDGRKLTADDKFEFVLTEDATGKSVTVNNTSSQFTEDGKPVPSVVAFKASEVSFLNYRQGAFEDPATGQLVESNDVGDHTYTVEEKYYDKNGIVSDTSKYKITVSVTPNVDEKGNPILNSAHTGSLIAKVKSVDHILSENNKEEFDYADGNYFEFKNTFKATGKVDFDGIKHLQDQAGAAIVSPDSLLNQFGFAVYQYSDAARTLDKTLVTSARTAADGKFKLDVPEYDQEILKNEKGEYVTEKTLYYRIVETKPSNGVWVENNTIFESEGIIYDNTEYDVDVTVKYDGTSALKIEKAIRKADTGESVTQIEYTNIVRKYVVVEGNKFWVDKVKDPATRPDVVVHLYSSGVGNGIPIINTYTIKAPDTTYRFATDKDGNQLPAYDYKGRAIKYTVKEVPVSGYLAEQNGYDLINTLGDILIRKIDESTGAPLSGATLAIFDGSTEIERWVSGASAHVIESELKPGKTYTLREISAPEGYDVADDMTFTVPTDGKNITVTMSDPPIIGSVRLTKRDATTRETLAGAEFALYTDAGARIYATGSTGSYRATDSTSNGVFVTDSAGTLTISDLPYGTYYFVETKAPEGYALSSERLGFTVLRTGELVEVTYLNTKSTGSVRLRKVGEGGTRSLAGAVFELYAATPRSIGQAASSTIFSNAYYRYGTYRTNSNGEIYVGDLPWDEYYFIEVEAPDGYELAKDVNGDDLVYTFTINAASADRTIDLGGIVNTPERPPITPPPGPTPTPTPGVLGARVKRGGVVNGVLGVRAKPSSGVLGVRVGPVTGDASNIILWLLLLSACVATIVATIITGRKKKTATK